MVRMNPMQQVVRGGTARFDMNACGKNASGNAMGWNVGVNGNIEVNGSHGFNSTNRNQLN